MKTFRFKLLVASSVLILASSFLILACSRSTPVEPIGGAVPASGGLAARTPSTAIVEFGQENVGSPFPPPQGHDHSSNAQDNLVPRTVVISRGGTVTFKTFGVHGVAIYAPGTEPGDIDTSVLAPPQGACPPVPLINDPGNLVAVVAPQPCAGGTTTPSFTFTDPGRYLVICRFLPHFVEFKMYGWVIVQ